MMLDFYAMLGFFCAVKSFYYERNFLVDAFWEMRRMFESTYSEKMKVFAKKTFYRLGLHIE